MAEEKEPPRKREYLPPLKHTTLTSLLDQGPVAIRLLASSKGHASIAADSSIPEEMASTVRARDAAREIRNNIPEELKVKVYKGRRYWHKKRDVFVTVIECSVGEFESGHRQHLVVDDDGNKFRAAEGYLEIV